MRHFVISRHEERKRRLEEREQECKNHHAEHEHACEKERLKQGWRAHGEPSESEPEEEAAATRANFPTGLAEKKFWTFFS